MSNTLRFYQWTQQVSQLGDRYLVGCWNAMYEPIRPPDPIFISRRPTGNSGSGPYFRAEAKPYLEENKPAFCVKGGTRYLLEGEITQENNHAASRCHGKGAPSEHATYSVASWGGVKLGIGSIDHYYYFYETPDRVRGIHTRCFIQGLSGGRPINWAPWRQNYPHPTVSGLIDLMPVYSLGHWSPTDTHVTDTRWTLDLGGGQLMDCRREYMGYPSGTNYQDPSVYYEYKMDEEGINDSRFQFYQILDGPVWSSLYRDLVGNAYLDALGSLPEVSANTIANIKDLIDPLAAAKKVLQGNIEPIVAMARNVSDPRNDWLTWRYVYNTTKMDIADYRDITNRLVSLVSMCDEGNTHFKQDGYYRIDNYSAHFVGIFDVTDFLPQCWVPNEDGTFNEVQMSDFKKILDVYGVRLNAVNTWDMIPFSFMVDWFLNIGTTLERWDILKRGYDLHMTDFWYSISYHGKSAYAYSRWHAPLPDVTPAYHSRETSKRTLTYRLADTVSIFT